MTNHSDAALLLIKQRRLSVCGNDSQRWDAVLGFTIWNQGSKLGHRVLCHREELRITLDSDASVPYCARGGHGRTAAHEGIKDHALTQRQSRAHYLAHETLWFQRRMRGDVALCRPGRRTTDYVAERLFRSNPAKSACLPLAEIILNAALAWFPEESPRFPTGPWHHRDIFEFLVCVLRAISTSESLDQADNLTAFFQASLDKSGVNQVRKERIRGDEYMPSRDKHSAGAHGPVFEELHELLLLGFTENGEPGQRTTDAAPNRGRDAPDPTTAFPQFALLLICVFLEAVRWISHNGVDTIRFAVLHPGEAIPANKFVQFLVCPISRLWLGNNGVSSQPFCHIAILRKRVAQEFRRLGWVGLEYVPEISREVTCQNQERTRISHTGFRKANHRRFGWPCLSSLKARNVPFGNPESLREPSLGQPTTKAGRLHVLPELLDGRVSAPAGGRVRVSHRGEYGEVYRSSQPFSWPSPALSRKARNSLANNRLQRTARRSAAAEPGASEVVYVGPHEKAP